MKLTKNNLGFGDPTRGGPRVNTGVAGDTDYQGVPVTGVTCQRSGRSRRKWIDCMGEGVLLCSGWFPVYKQPFSECVLLRSGWFPVYKQPFS